MVIKVESVFKRHPRLEIEEFIYEQLHSDGSTLDKGIPNIYYAAEGKIYYLIVMDKLGPSLEDLFIKCNKKFSLKTILMLADQMLTRIEFVHKNGFLHRDINQGNFIMGVGSNSHKLYIIDFDFGGKCREKDGSHIKYEENLNPIGNVYYSSINSNLGIKMSRRDDLESIAYMLIKFLRGSLPWDNIKVEKYFRDKILEKKLTELNYQTLELFCMGIPVEFKTFLKSVMGLRFDEKPDYDFLRKIFQDLFKLNGYEFDYVYDW